LDRTFTEEEYQLLSLGLIPEVMEDKWFIYLDGDWLSFHRSWTGYCIYQVRLAHEDGTYRIAEVWVNRDPAQYSSQDAESDAAILSRILIDSFLLDRRLGPDGLREMHQHIRRTQGQPTSEES
jgi:hypothetical protein